MLKLIFDIKCGYEKFYLTEKYAEFPLEFLTSREIFEKNNKNLNLQYLTETELFIKYGAYPEQLINDYGLFEVIRSIISIEYYAMCFKTFKRDEKQFFPELFTLENVRLIKTDEEFLDQDLDIAPQNAGGQA